jgi:hypothetical protein
MSTLNKFFLIFVIAIGSPVFARWANICPADSVCSKNHYTLEMWEDYNRLAPHATGLPTIVNNQALVPLSVANTRVNTLIPAISEAGSLQILNSPYKDMIGIDANINFGFGMDTLFLGKQTKYYLDKNWQETSKSSLANGTQQMYFVGPLLKVGKKIVYGVRGPAQDLVLNVSDDSLQNWTEIYTGLKSGHGYRLHTWQDGRLWVVSAQGTGIQETTDLGITWRRVDNGSLSLETSSLAVDPNNPRTLYANTEIGLYRSLDGGVAWSLFYVVSGGSYSLDFLDAKVWYLGTSKGVMRSIDQGKTFHAFDNGLPAAPYAVRVVNGSLYASSDAGTYTCISDCISSSAVTGLPDPNARAAVVEYYHPALNHYFMTADVPEIKSLDASSWQRTEREFKSFGSELACRFYGDYTIGPNSHFYSTNPKECSDLIALAKSQAKTEKKWNFESWPFYVLPFMNAKRDCDPEAALAVTRFYNDGFRKGIDSNHRYVTNQADIDAMKTKGWINEGLVFCALK